MDTKKISCGSSEQLQRSQEGRARAQTLLSEAESDTSLQEVQNSKKGDMEKSLVEG